MSWAQVKICHITSCPRSLQRKAVSGRSEMFNGGPHTVPLGVSVCVCVCLVCVTHSNRDTRKQIYFCFSPLPAVCKSRSYLPIWSRPTEMCHLISFCPLAANKSSNPELTITHTQSITQEFTFFFLSWPRNTVKSNIFFGAVLTGEKPCIWTMKHKHDKERVSVAGEWWTCRERSFLITVDLLWWTVNSWKESQQIKPHKWMV